MVRGDDEMTTWVGSWVVLVVLSDEASVCLHHHSSWHGGVVMMMVYCPSINHLLCHLSSSPAHYHHHYHLMQLTYSRIYRLSPTHLLFLNPLHHIHSVTHSYPLHATHFSSLPSYSLLSHSDPHLTKATHHSLGTFPVCCVMSSAQMK
ncbi:hypothetical protein Pmani_018806 [Petrolisthes manimaculis]|uniref:Uncharacterized protein n=1 Tax=Petrolisthes manimaculis TaxID=1843537 RepID=A0AAE1PJM0_9EUCA|nr:hypothetical protein Pmani_018806 [Petrolisthes manimaculis]